MSFPFGAVYCAESAFHLAGTRNVGTSSLFEQFSVIGVLPTPKCDGISRFQPSPIPAQSVQNSVGSSWSEPTAGLWSQSSSRDPQFARFMERLARPPSYRGAHDV